MCTDEWGLISRSLATTIRDSVGWVGLAAVLDLVVGPGYDACR